MQSRLKNPNFYYLLAGLLSLLLINPTINDLLGYSSNFLTSVTFSSCMIIGIWSLHGSKTLFRLALVLIAISTTLSILNPLYPQLPLEMFNMLVVLIFCIMSAIFILAEITADLKVDANRVVGGICLYLLIGLVFGIAYTILEALLPGSFSKMPEQAQSMNSELIYYSYVTLTSVGYGDIVPLRPLVRTIAYLEAIIGVFYMAIMIGSMIGLLLNRAGSQTKDSKSQT
ncbi:MAG: ion channel [Gammaproteobacteria bacterium]|nr:ion channel [Gammaproteobacteria bacterium]